MSVFTYAPDEMTLVVGGVVMSGFADGTFITVSRDEQAFNKVTGADGTVSRAKTANRSGTLALVLTQTSPSNDVLSGFMIADELANQGVVPVLLKDKSGRTVVFSSAAWVQQSPDAAFSKNIENREWTLDCGRLEIFIGGNISQQG
jgi:hypothetical protein